MKALNVLVGCECSGNVRDEFRKRGHNAWSCDLLPSENMEYHLQGDIRERIERAPNGERWDLFIVFPTCTYLCNSGLHWNKRGRMVDGRPRAELTAEAIDFCKWLMLVDIPHIAMENPTGCLSTKYRKPNQIIQPWQFGHDASKATCLWLKDLPKLQPTDYIAPRYVCQDCKHTTFNGYSGACSHCASTNVKERWANQTDSGQNKLGPSDDRAAIRAVTYPGIARAMAAVYSAYCIEQIKA